MADTVDSQVLANTKNQYVVHIQNRSDGTGESDAVKVDKSGLVGPLGVEPGRLKLERVQGSVDGMSVRLAWDHDTDDELLTLGPGVYDIDLRSGGGGIVDPASAGGTGDVLLSTLGHTAGDGYDLTLYFRKKA